MTTASLEVADIFRLHWLEYCQQHGESVTPLQHRIASAIMNCRTEALGGHVLQCTHCGYREQRYNSCRNRHCPKCQGHKAAEWVEERKDELLPVQYFHAVFTLPHELNELVLMNKKLIYEILFKAVAQTLSQIGQRNLKCQLGFFTVLHTWGQTLTLHPHLHVVIPGCGLSLDGQNLVRFKKRYFVPQKILSLVFQGKFIALLKKAYRSRKLIGEFDDFEAFLNRVVRSAWVVHIKPPFAGPLVVLKYLSRYVQRIALSNRRLVSLDHGTVSFTYRDYRLDAQPKVLHLNALEFIRRFLLHTLPHHFVRVRYYGFLTRSLKEAALAKLRCYLAAPLPKEKTATIPHTNLCPRCKRQTLVIICEIPRLLASFHAPAPPCIST